jgi:hypothetical protein
MAFTPDEIANINNSTLETFLDRGKVWKQDLANKPMLEAFQDAAGSFVGGKENVSFAVSSGYGGGSLQGYTGDDQLAHYNPVGTKRVRFPWKEHYIGMVVTMTELKEDGIDVIENGTDQRTREMSGREMQALANLFDEKNEKVMADYNFSLDRLVHGDGSTDTKALAGIRALILDVPTTGSTGGLNRVSNTFWRNRAATAAFGSAGGQGAITVNTANGGALIAFMDKEWRLLNKFKTGATKIKYFAGSDFIEGYKLEMRANSRYSDMGFGGSFNADGSMKDPSPNGIQLIWDPTLDDLGLSKRCYAIDFGKAGVRLLYMDGQRLKKHNPARPYDRMVMYNGMSMTGVMVAKQLNTSGVYDIV